MLGIGGGELAIILVFGFLLFGPDKLPQMGRTIGRAMRQFRETQEKLTAVVQTEVVDPMAAAAQAPAKAKKTVVDEDADADAPATEAPARKETFAERRARLAAEKAAGEAGSAERKAAAEENGVKGEEAGTRPEEVSSAEPASAAAPATAPAPAEEAPAPRTTEDLYARRPRRAKAAQPSDEAFAAVPAPGQPAADTISATAEGGDL